MEVTRLFEFMHYQKENYPLEKSMGYKNNGKWTYFSTDDMIEMANDISRGLLKLGLRPGDKIALLAYKNRPEWIAMDLGAQQVGMITVPVYPTISPKEYVYIFNDSEVKYAFVGGDDLHDKVSAAQKDIPSLQEIYTFDKQSGKNFWKEMWDTQGSMEPVQKIMDSIDPADMATIIYTSGTTGNPKGVMLSHNNIVSNVVPVRDLLPCLLYTSPSPRDS